LIKTKNGITRQAEICLVCPLLPYSSFPVSWGAWGRLDSSAAARTVMSDVLETPDMHQHQHPHLPLPCFCASQSSSTDAQPNRSNTPPSPLHFLSPNPLPPFPLPSTHPTSCRRLQMLQDPPPRPHHRLVAFAATNAGLDWQCWAACLCYAARTTGTTAIDSPPRTGLDGIGLARCPQKCSTTFGLRCRLSDPKLPQPGRRLAYVPFLGSDRTCCVRGCPVERGSVGAPPKNPLLQKRGMAPWTGALENTKTVLCQDWAFET
jgi:hypothetical protein